MYSQQNAMVECLLCYLDEVVENFEEFMKKSLLLFSVGGCTVVVMLVYVLKMLTEKGLSIKSSKILSIWPVDNGKLYPIISTHEVTLRRLKPKVACTSANTLVMKSIWPSYEEQVLRNIGFSNCHKCMQIGESIENLHTSFENIHRQITLPSDSKRQRTMTPVCYRRDLSLPSRIPHYLRTPPLEGLWNIPQPTPVPIPSFDIQDERQVDNGDVNQDDNEDESQSEKGRKSNIELHRQHESKSAYKISERRMQSLPTPEHHRQLTLAHRNPSPAPQPLLPNSPELTPKRKILQKVSSFPRHGDYLRTKK